MNINEYSSYSSSDITKLIRNRNVSDPFQPGTMIDGMVLAAAMDLSVGGTYECSEDILINDEVVRCWSKHHHGKQSVSELLENSCNVGLSKLALDLNKDNLYSYLFKFGIGSKTSAIFNNESKGYLKEIRYARYIYVAKAAERQEQQDPIAKVVHGCPYLLRSAVGPSLHAWKVRFTLRHQFGNNSDHSALCWVLAKKTRGEQIVAVFFDAVWIVQERQTYG